MKRLSLVFLMMAIPGIAPADCALWQDPNFEGLLLYFPNNTGVLYVGDEFNDQASSAAVSQECVLYIYEDINYGGESVYIPPGYYSYIGDEWNDRVSSAICYCP